MYMDDKALLAPGALDGASLVVGFTVYETVDDRGGLGVLVGVFLSQTDAEKANERAGWYGGPGRLGRANILVLGGGRKFVLGSMTEFADFDINLSQHRRDQRAAARAKLTNEEAALLGVKDE